MFGYEKFAVNKAMNCKKLGNFGSFLISAISPKRFPTIAGGISVATPTSFLRPFGHRICCFSHP